MILFLDEDAEYARWLEHHPNGYVINVKSGSARPMLHTARCTHLYPPNYARATRVPKACDADRRRLEAWARQSGYDAVPCPDCDV